MASIATRDPFCRLARLCIIAGLLLAALFPVYANLETEARHERYGRWIVNYQRGLPPVSTPVDPWPGVYAGAALAAFGVLVLAVRWPKPQTGGR